MKSERLTFHPEDAGSRILRKVGKFLPVYMVSHAKRQYSSVTGVRDMQCHTYASTSHTGRDSRSLVFPHISSLFLIF
jgi:hypothetical protein